MNATKVQALVKQSIKNLEMTPGEIKEMILDHTKGILEAKDWYEGDAYIARVEYLSQRIAAYTEALKSD